MPQETITLSPFAEAIATRQYAQKDKVTQESQESYGDILARVAKHVARAEAIDAYKRDNGRYPEWYISFEGRRKNLLNLVELDDWIERNGYTALCAQWEEEFLRILTNQYFSPAGRILAGSGSQYGQMMNCFVLGPNGRYIKGADDGDSIDGIYELSYKLAKVTKTGGGCGLSLNFMRESGSYVNGSGGRSSGPVSFLRLNYNTTLRVIKLEGVRRGAGMATMKITHPDVLDFITAKDKDREAVEGAIECFNISLLITDEFMENVEKDAWHTVVNHTGKPIAPSPVRGKYHLPGEPATSVTGNPNDPNTSKEIPLALNGYQIKAKWLWDEITEHAHQTGDPGVLFIDRINDYWPFREVLGELEATNPCGEEPLWFGESCCLGSLVLDRFVDDTGTFNNELFEYTTRTAIRFLDNVLTINVHPIEDTQEWCDRLRRVGLGVMGDAVMMTKMGCGYASPAAYAMRHDIGNALRRITRESSEQLAEEKGAFPFSEHLPEGIGPRRNVHTLSIAPTGTISMICDTSSGIEPQFALAMQRRVGTDYKFRVDPNFERYLRAERPDIDLDDETQYVDIDLPVGNDANGKAIREKVKGHPVIKAIMKNHGSIQGLTELFTTEEQVLFATAHDVTPAQHVKVQSTWQTSMDDEHMMMASISKTVNMSNDASVQDVQDTYELGFRQGLKGITMYRDGSRDAQVLRTDVGEDTEKSVPAAPIHSIEEAKETIASEYPQPLVMHRPRATEGQMIKAEFRDANSKARKVYVYVGKDDIGYPLEVFITDEDGGYDVHPYAAALGKMISMALKHGATPLKVAEKLIRIEGGSVSFTGAIYNSVPAMVGKLLLNAVDEMELDLEFESDECNHVNMRMEGGCYHCPDCGYSKCV